MMLTSVLAQLYFCVLVHVLEIFARTKRLTSQPTLLTLPDELLYEILNLLDWKALLVIKLTCRHMHTITKSRFLWTSKASEMSLKSGSWVLEGPAESYSVEELEQKVIKRLKVEEKWRNPDPSTFRSRKLKVDTMSRRRMHLLPGGRWLLDNIAGYVYALDLDRPELAPQLLFEERHCTYTGRVLDPLGGCAIWIDPSEPWLSLRVALHNDSPSASLGPSRVCIYQLDFNGRNANMTWAVKPLVTLMCPGPCLKQGLQLGEDHAIERCLYKDRDVETWKVHVFRYSEPVPRLCVWEYPTAATVIPLPGNRLVAITDSDPHAEFFNIRTPNESYSLVLEPSFRIPLHSSPTSSISRVYVSHHSCYIMTTCKDSFDALQVPHEAGLPPIVKRFRRDGIEDHYLSLGLSLMAVLQRDQSMDLTTYDLRDEQVQVQSGVRIRAFPGAGYLRLIACDEGSGRIIMRNLRMTFLLEI